MPNLDDILRGRLALLGEAPSTFERDAATVASALASALDRLLAEFDRSGGRLVRSPESVALAASMVPALVRALDEAGYQDVVADYLDRYAEVVTRVLATFAAVRLDAAFSTPVREMAEAARSLDLQTFRAYGEAAAREIQRSIAQAVLFERDYTSTVEQLERVITGTDRRGHLLARHANTFAGTAIAQFDRLVSRAQGDEAGVDQYRYWGPLDDATRPWCRRILKDNRPRQVEEIESLPPSPTNTTGEANFTGAGGWNCRHMWVPAVEES